MSRTTHLGGVKSFEEGGEFNSEPSGGVINFLGQYAGTLISSGVALGMAGYALAGKGSLTKRGLAVAGSIAGALVTVGMFEDESYDAPYPRR